MIESGFGGETHGLDEDVLKRIEPEANMKSCVAGSDFATLVHMGAGENVLERVEPEAVLEVEQTFDIPVSPSSSKGRQRKKKAKRILEQDEFPRRFDEVSEAVLA